MSSRPRLLTVGPYERDNVGDLLFLLVTEAYLPDFDIVPGAPFASDMTDVLGRQVVAYGDVLAGEQVDAIWSVGGQIGGVGLEGAFGMSRPPAEVEAYRDASAGERAALLRAAYGGAPIVSPYLPTPGAFERNAGAVTVANSVGLAGIAGLRPHVREELVEVLRTTDVVSVRDPQSAEVLTRFGIEHRLVPDVVHALGALEPAEPDPTSETVVVQVSTVLLNRIGRRRLARILVGSESLAGLRIQLVLAGTAAHHDSFEDMERVAEEIRRLDPGREVEIRTERRPLDIVDTVRRARVVISSSLHLRIIAAAYGLPRLTLKRVKPTNYAAHWDPLMPYHVPSGELDDAVAAALAAAGRADVRAASDRLVRLADDNARGIADDVRRLVGSDPQERARISAARRAAYLTVSARRAECDSRTGELEAELEAVRRELAEARLLLDQPRAWRRRKETVPSGSTPTSK